ncbi:inositol monophosphatase family protein [Halorhabdus rudnickae]|uniref:inositol monophosphatase family protein n=1 Tax=Halorhabdus rudnickae TaxID=1775544 RepID=UPI001082530A|nr:inositol monophosphatase family protein [Halorhabdus rudnickae]
MDFDAELAVARRAARAAGELIDSEAGTEFRAATATDEKSAVNDIVTAVDRECQERIVTAISEQFPDDRIVGEETGTADRQDAGREWIVDPIDGTANFATGFPYFCVSIAFRVDGKSHVGVVHSPEAALGRTWYAVAGEGAYCATDDGEGEPIGVSEYGDLAGALVHCRVSERDGARRARDLAVATTLLERGVKLRRTASTALNLCQVASGTADGYVVLSSNEWDYAAGELLVTEAGGTVRRRSAPAMDDEVVATNGHLQGTLERLVDTATGRRT